MSTKPPVDVAHLYDSPEGQIGPDLFGGHLHWGYWDESTAAADFAAGAEKLAQLMVQRTDITEGQRFADLGCGVGLPAIKLAEATGCFVDGITISGSQQRRATENAERAGLQDRLRFIHGTALEVPRPDATYDGAWFFESIFHMGHEQALSEASRIMKPGAKLVLTDLPILAHTTDSFLAQMDEHIHSKFITLDEYPALMQRTGFELLEIEDITGNVMPWLVSKFKETLVQHEALIKQAVPEETDKVVDNWVYLFEVMSENLGYVIVSAKRKN